MRASITINNFKKYDLSDPKSYELLSKKERASFLLKDIYGALNKLGKKECDIIEIPNIICDQSEKEDLLKKSLEYFKDKDTVICTTAYISGIEFPEEEYCLTEEESHESGKKLIPVDEVLERETKIIENAGFVNVNDYIGYEFQIAFIYPNEIGKMVIDLFNDLNKKEEEQKEKIEYENINCQ